MPDATLNIAIVHYHLKPGGVTTVVAHALRALRRREGTRVAVFSGEKDECGKAVLTHQHVVPGLGYGAQDWLSAQALTERLLAAARAAFGGIGPDVWHFHNHSLGKNPLWPEVLRRLLDRGERLLLQIHDFAEDGRPDNFAVARRAEVLYPCHPRAHYALLNQRDLACLREAGPDLPVHYLPNPVPPVPQTRVAGRRSFPAKPLIVYPTRGIRRKNLGEVAFLAALLGDRAQWVTTRRPANAIWQGIHAEWEAFAQRLALPLVYGAVETLSPHAFAGRAARETSFQAWMDSADVAVTTSVAEGFGLAFLEPTTLGLPLLGRDLPEVTRGFGLDLRGLYRALRLPLAWVGEARMAEALERRLTEYYRRYGRSMPPSAAEQALQAMLDASGHLVDFGRLDETMQRHVISRMLDDPAGRDAVMVEVVDGLFPAVAWFEDLLNSESWQREAEENAGPLQDRFSLETYSDRLYACYDALQASPEGNRVTPNAVGKELLDRFLDPRRFQFLRS